jgi:hypothetical protein
MQHARGFDGRGLPVIDVLSSLARALDDEQELEVPELASFHIPRLTKAEDWPSFIRQLRFTLETYYLWPVCDPDRPYIDPIILLRKGEQPSHERAYNAVYERLHQRWQAEHDPWLQQGRVGREPEIRLPTEEETNREYAQMLIKYACPTDSRTRYLQRMLIEVDKLIVRHVSEQIYWAAIFKVAYEGKSGPQALLKAIRAILGFGAGQ